MASLTFPKPHTRLMLSSSDYPGLVTLQLQELTHYVIGNRPVWKRIGEKLATSQECAQVLSGMCRTEEDVQSDVDAIDVELRIIAALGAHR